MQPRLLVVLAAVFLACAGTANATVVEFFEDRELFQEADLVVVGKVWQKQVVPGPGIVETHYEVEVQEGLKGAKKGRFIVLSAIGGEVNGISSFASGVTHPSIGDQVILFLQRLPSGTYTAIALALGHYTLQYRPGLKRFIAHRDVGALTLLRKNPTRGTEDTVTIPSDRMASEVLSELRALAGNAP